MQTKKISLIVNEINVSIIFLGIFFSYYLLTSKVALIVAGSLVVVAMIMFIVFLSNHHLKSKVSREPIMLWPGFISSIGIGISIGAIMSRYSLRVYEHLLCALAITILIFLLYIIWNKKISLVISLIIISVLAILSFIFSKEYKILIENGLVLISLFFNVIILLIAYNKPKETIYLFLSTGMFFAFIIIFWLALITITEGDALELGDFSFDIGGKKRRKK